MGFHRGSVGFYRVFIGYIRLIGLMLLLPLAPGHSA